MNRPAGFVIRDWGFGKTNPARIATPLPYRILNPESPIPAFP